MLLSELSLIAFTMTLNIAFDKLHWHICTTHFSGHANVQGPEEIP
jgi:hypothetical protein